MTDAELAILSIVAEGPIYGYDIQSVIVQRGLRAWTNIGVSSMYYVLEKLEHQGLIEGKAVSRAEDAARRQYHITSAGFGVLQTAVADLISTPREYADGFELGLANLHVLRPAQIRTAFVTYRQELTQRLNQARDHWQHLKGINAPFNVDAMFGHHVAMLEAELAWIKDFIDQWEAQAPPDDSLPPAPPPADIPRMKQVVLPQDPDSTHRAPTRPIRPSSAPPHRSAPKPQAESHPQPAEKSPHSPTTLVSSETPRDFEIPAAPPDADTASDDD